MLTASLVTTEQSSIYYCFCCNITTSFCFLHRVHKDLLDLQDLLEPEECLYASVFMHRSQTNMKTQSVF